MRVDAGCELLPWVFPHQRQQSALSEQELLNDPCVTTDTADETQSELSL